MKTFITALISALLGAFIMYHVIISTMKVETVDYGVVEVSILQHTHVYLYDYDTQEQECEWVRTVLTSDYDNIDGDSLTNKE